MPHLSVIIPTRDRPGLLRDCLRTIQTQHIGTGQVEVVVVDDGSEQRLEPVLAHALGPIEIRCVRTPPGGLNAARNCGVHETTGTILAFLDDDTLLAPGWASAIIGAFESAECAGLAGRITLQFEGTPPRWLSKPQRDYLAEFDLGDQPRWLDRGPVPVGANCAVRREALQRIGGFRVGLDRLGSSLVSNGDTEFFRRLRTTGGRLRYEPAARVLHRVPPSRLTSSFFRRRAYAQGISDVLLAHTDGRGSRSMLVGRELWRYGRAGPILARGLLTGAGPMNALQWTSYCHGRLHAVSSGHQ